MPQPHLCNQKSCCTSRTSCPWDIHSSLGHSFVPGTFIRPWDIHSSLAHSFVPGIFIRPWDIHSSLGHSFIPVIFIRPWDIHSSLGHSFGSGTFVPGATKGPKKLTLFRWYYIASSCVNNVDLSSKTRTRGLQNNKNIN